MAVLTYFQVYKCHLSFEIIKSLFLLVFGLISSCEECNTNDKEGQARNLNKNDKRWQIIEMQFGEYLSEHPTPKIILKLH